MPIQIFGKSYVTVAERVAGMHEDTKDAQVEIRTEIVADDEWGVTVKATVTTPCGTFTGHARSRKDGSGIEAQAPLEVAETSAVGRALGFAGYGVVESVATADEVVVAQSRSGPPSVDINKPPEEAGPQPSCFHGAMQYRTGQKNGKLWKAWMCAADQETPKEERCSPKWVD